MPRQTVNCHKPRLQPVHLLRGYLLNAFPKYIKLGVDPATVLAKDEPSQIEYFRRFTAGWRSRLSAQRVSRVICTTERTSPPFQRRYRRANFTQLAIQVERDAAAEGKVLAAAEASS